MKRLLPLFFILCLFLTGCSPTQPPTEPSATTEPPPTETAPTEPTETEPPRLQVSTDFSQYAPQTPVEAKYTRLSPEPLQELRPTSVPTRIFPFPGRILADAYGGMYFSEERFKYGIVDETGCILADPVYSSAALLYKENTWERLPYWVLEKIDVRTETTEDGFEYRDSVSRYAFASIDGTFVSDCIYTSITAYEDRILAFYPSEDGSQFGFDVYDGDHTLLFSSYSLSFSDKLGGGPYQFSYGDGLYTIAFESRTYESDGYSLTDYTYYYMDEGGNLVLGPYYDASQFSHGKAAVRLTEEGNYVFINKNGAQLSGEYSGYQFLSNGYVIVPEEGHPSNHHDLLNEDLEVITFLPGYCYPTDDGNIQVYDSYNNIYCYTLDGEQLWRRSNAIFQSSDLCQYSELDVSYLENMETGKKWELPASYSYCNIMGNPTDPIITVHCSGQSIFYLNKDLEELDLSATSYEYMPMNVPGLSYRSAICIADQGRSLVYTEASTAPMTYPVKDCRMAALYPDRFASLTTPTHTYLFTPEGDLLFAYPINPMDD